MTDTPPSTILIVDDNPHNLQVLANILREVGYRVATGKDGAKALAFVEKRRPDLILLDVMMPEMDGFEVCRRLKAGSATRDIPVLFISALTETADKVSGFEAGGLDYITKPFQKEEVLARVHAHLSLKHAREALEGANRDLSRANATKDKLFSIIGHDLRGPLGSLIHLLEGMAENPDTLTPEEQSAVLKNLHVSAKGAYHLLENLLSWARSQRGDIQRNPSDLQLAELVNTNFRQLGGIARDKSITLRSAVADDITAHADADMVLLVIRNLVSNAIKFTPEGGEVAVSAAAGDSEVTVSVADTGVGIPEENRGLLFRPDTHLTTRGTHDEKGSGLGLMLCRDLVEQNGGAIRVDERPGGGSVFRFTLPAGGDKA